MLQYLPNKAGLFCVGLQKLASIVQTLTKTISFVFLLTYPGCKGIIQAWPYLPSRGNKSKKKYPKSSSEEASLTLYWKMEKQQKNKRKRYYSRPLFLRTSKPKRIFTRTFVKAKLSKKFFFSTRIVHCEKKKKFKGTKVNKNISQLVAFIAKSLS